MKYVKLFYKNKTKITNNFDNNELNEMKKKVE